METMTLRVTCTDALFFTTCTNLIIHLFHPPKNLHRHCFRLLAGHFNVQGEIANNGYAKVLRGDRDILWYCASSESES